MAGDRLHALGHDRASEPRLPSPAGWQAALRPPGNGRKYPSCGGPAAVRYTILDATHRLKDGKLVRPAFTSLHFWRVWNYSCERYFSFLPENIVENIVRPKRWKKRIKKSSFGKLEIRELGTASPNPNPDFPNHG